MKYEPKRCPTCSHIVDDRVLRLNQTLVRSLYRVWRWCEANNKWEFDRKDIKHLLTTDTMIASFGDLIYFGGILYRPEDDKHRGSWAMNRDRARMFFANQHVVPARVVIDRISNAIVKHEEPIVMRQVPRLTDFLDSEYQYLPEYREGSQTRALGL